MGLPYAYIGGIWGVNVGIYIWHTWSVWDTSNTTYTYMITVSTTPALIGSHMSVTGRSCLNYLKKSQLRHRHQSRCGTPFLFIEDAACLSVTSENERTDA